MKCSDHLMLNITNSIISMMNTLAEPRVWAELREEGVKVGGDNKCLQDYEIVKSIIYGQF